MIDVLLSPSDYLRGWNALLTAGTLRTVPSESKLLAVVPPEYVRQSILAAPLNFHLELGFPIRSDQTRQKTFEITRAKRILRTPTLESHHLVSHMIASIPGVVPRALESNSSREWAKRSGRVLGLRIDRSLGHPKPDFRDYTLLT